MLIWLFRFLQFGLHQHVCWLNRLIKLVWRVLRAHIFLGLFRWGAINFDSYYRWRTTRIFRVSDCRLWPFTQKRLLLTLILFALFRDLECLLRYNVRRFILNTWRTTFLCCNGTFKVVALDNWFSWAEYLDQVLNLFTKHLLLVRIKNSVDSANFGAVYVGVP